MEDSLRVVTINEKEYNIGRFSSGTGSWMLMRFMKLFRDFIKELDDDGTQPTQDDGKGDTQQFSENLLQTLLSELDEVDFAKVQKHCLLVVTRTEFVGEKPYQQPVMMPNGKFAFKELATDIAAVTNLTSQTVFSNLHPFFTKTGLKAIMSGEVPALNR